MFINCHTCYSLKYGLLSPKELVSAAQKLGVRSLALTDINNTSCAYQFVDACRAQGIKPVLGVEFREENELLYVGIAKNDEGWKELCEWLTRHSLAGEPLPKIAPDWQHCYVIYRKLPKGVQHLNANEFVGVRPEEVNHLYASYMKNHQDRLVVFSPVTFMDNDGFRAHKLLRCIDLNIVVSKLTLKDHAKASEVFYEEA